MTKVPVVSGKYNGDVLMYKACRQLSDWGRGMSSGNEETAAAWYRKAAAQGHEEAQSALAFLVQTPVPRSYLAGGGDIAPRLPRHAAPARSIGLAHRTYVDSLAGGRRPGDKGEPVAVVVDLDPVKIVIDVPERQIANVSVFDVAQAHLVDGHSVTGKVAFVANQANPSTRTFRVEMALPNPDGLLREGTTARVVLPLGTEMAHRVSPAILTLSDVGEVGIKTVDETNTVHFHPVSMVADTEDGMWLGGLPETARVIIVGQEFVRAGQKVVTKPEAVVEKTQ